MDKLIRGTKSLELLWYHRLHIGQRRSPLVYWNLWSPIARALTMKVIIHDWSSLSGATRLTFTADIPLQLRPPRHCIEDFYSSSRKGLCKPTDSNPKIFRKGLVKGFQWNPEIHIQNALLYCESRGIRYMKKVAHRSDLIKKMVTGLDRIENIVEQESQESVQSSLPSLLPDPSLVTQNVVRLDVASMRAHRHWHEEHHPVVRYSFVDASPLGGYEILNSSEIVIPRAAFRGKKTLMEISDNDIVFRRHPPVGLALGNCDAANKAEAYLHQTWLDYGSSTALLKSALDGVVSMLVDLGVERLVNDYFDIVPFYLSGREPEEATIRATDFLLKNSMHIAGPEHIIDWLIRETLSNISWFPGFLKSIKAALQWISVQSHADYLIEKVKLIFPDDLVMQNLLVEQLDAAVEKFAVWRWRSISAACSDMVRLRLLLRFVCVDECPSCWSSTDTEGLKAIDKIVRNEGSFYGQVHCVQFIIKWPMSLDGFVRSCPCHEVERMAGIAVKCKKCGMRAPEYAEAVRQVITNIDNDISSLTTFTEEYFGSGVCLTELRNRMTRLVARTDYKFLSWLDDIPYIIWKAFFATMQYLIYSMHDDIVQSPCKPSDSKVTLVDRPRLGYIDRP